MKKILLTLLALSSYCLLDAQYYYFKDSIGTNPGNLNQDDTEYPSGSGLASGWTEILAGSQATPAISAAQTIPFTFSFNGGAVTTYKAISNGSISFASTAAAPTSYTSVALPSSTVADSSVNILGIKGTGSNDKIMTKTFGTAPNRQHWIFFTSYAGSASWSYWSIVLEETTNKIYIVDQRHGAASTGISMGIQINSTSAIAVTGSPTLTSLAGSDPSSADNLFYEFIPGTQPMYDMAAKSSTMDNIVLLSNAPYTVKGTIQNRGSATVTSYDMNYKVNAGSVVTANISGASIANGAVGSFSHPTAWTPTAIGTYTIEAWASNINGNTDLVPANDKITFTVSVVDTILPRKTLLEVFTSSTCGPCVAGNKKMDSVVLPTIDNYTVIKYQQNFPGSGDPYYTSESVNRRGFYGVSSIPRMEIDGQWDVNANSFSKAIFTSYQTKPAFIDIDITSARSAGPFVRVEATIKPYATLTGSLKYHVVVTERKTINNTGTNGETEFFEVMMDMIPDENGNFLTSLTTGVPTNINLVSNMASSNVEDFSDLRVVIFVQDTITKEVYQSEWMDVALSAVGTNEISNEVSLDLFPNPSNGTVTINYTANVNTDMNISIVNMIGETVYTTNGGNTKGSFIKNLDLSHLPKGVYMVNVNSGFGITTKKLVIQ